MFHDQDAGSKNKEYLSEFVISPSFALKYYELQLTN